MKYALEDTIEASRLEEQVHQTNYSIIDEMKDFHFSPDEKILDAGCGTGVLARYLFNEYGVKQVDGFDFSDLRLRQAEQLLNPAEKEGIHFYQQDLTQIDAKFHNTYHTVICRYVIEHVAEPMKVIHELKKLLKPGGRLIIVELDGVFINLFTPNEKLNHYLKEIKQKVPFDLEIGRKVPSMFKNAGFHGIEWSAKLLSCQGKSLDEEKANNEKRFAAIGPALLAFLGTVERSEDFKKLYLEEMLQPESTSVFTKYICTGIKS